MPAYARAIGGVKLVGLFGAGLTLGVAAALLLGSVLEGGGRQLAGRLPDHAPRLLRWRCRYCPMSGWRSPGPPSESEGLAREALTNQAWWRVQLLGLTTLTIPLVIGAWLVHFLITGYGMSAGAARGRSPSDCSGSRR